MAVWLVEHSVSTMVVVTASPQVGDGVVVGPVDGEWMDLGMVDCSVCYSAAQWVCGWDE